jgi:hypothetical protein
MATYNLDTATAAAKAEDLDQLATNIQIQAGRIRSLAAAIDQEIDFSCADEKIRDRLNRAYDYIRLLEEAADKAKLDGEVVELHAMSAKKAAAQ